MPRAMLCSHHESQDLPCFGQAHAGGWKSHISQEGGSNSLTTHLQAVLSPSFAGAQRGNSAAGRARCCLHKVQVQKRSTAPSSLALASQDTHTDQQCLSGCIRCALALHNDWLPPVAKQESPPWKQGRQCPSAARQASTQPASSVPDLCLHNQANTCPTTNPGLKHQLNSA